VAWVYAVIVVLVCLSTSWVFVLT